MRSAVGNSLAGFPTLPQISNIDDESSFYANGNSSFLWFAEKP